MYQIACVIELHTRYFLFCTKVRKILVGLDENEYFCIAIAKKRNY